MEEPGGERLGDRAAREFQARVSALCAPIARRRGLHDRADDLTQEILLALLERPGGPAADIEDGEIAAVARRMAAKMARVRAKPIESAELDVEGSPGTGGAVPSTVAAAMPDPPSRKRPGIPRLCPAFFRVARKTGLEDEMSVRVRAAAQAVARVPGTLEPSQYMAFSLAYVHEDGLETVVEALDTAKDSEADEKERAATEFLRRVSDALQEELIRRVDELLEPGPSDILDRAASVSARRKAPPLTEARARACRSILRALAQVADAAPPEASA